MLAETLTITTETQNAQGAGFQITTFEMTQSVFCDCCSNSADGTKTELTRRGWSFAQGAEFCPDCN
ncbi:MAG TPA: hypothetical protein VF599_12470 [Pyrinomonadaceae bacterium]|jgi:hypothetical protein